MHPSPQLSADSIKQATGRTHLRGEERFTMNGSGRPLEISAKLRGLALIVLLATLSAGLLPGRLGVPAEDLQILLFPPVVLLVLWTLRRALPRAVIWLGILSIPLCIIGACWSRGVFESRELLFISRNDSSRVSPSAEVLRVEYNRLAGTYHGPLMNLVQRRFSRGSAVDWLDGHQNTGILLHGSKGAVELSLSFGTKFPEISGRRIGVIVNDVPLEVVLYPERTPLQTSPVQPPIWHLRRIAAGLLRAREASSIDEALEILKEAGTGASLVAGPWRTAVPRLAAQFFAESAELASQLRSARPEAKELACIDDQFMQLSRKMRGSSAPELHAAFLNNLAVARFAQAHSIRETLKVRRWLLQAMRVRDRDRKPVEGAVTAARNSIALLHASGSWKDRTRSPRQRIRSQKLRRTAGVPSTDRRHRASLGGKSGGRSSRRGGRSG